LFHATGFDKGIASKFVITLYFDCRCAIGYVGLTPGICDAGYPGSVVHAEVD